MQISSTSTEVLNKLVRLRGYYLNGLTGNLVTNKNYYAIVDIAGEQSICTIPVKGGKPLTLGLKTGKAYPVTCKALSCFVPRLDVPGKSAISELRWLNQLNLRNGRGFKFDALVDIHQDTIQTL
jgi:hypothetical protein